MARKKRVIMFFILIILGTLLLFQMITLFTCKRSKPANSQIELSEHLVNFEEETIDNPEHMEIEKQDIYSVINDFFEFYKQSLLSKEINHDIYEIMIGSSSNSRQVFESMINYEIQRQQLSGESIVEFGYLINIKNLFIHDDNAVVNLLIDFDKKILEEGDYNFYALKNILFDFYLTKENNIWRIERISSDSSLYKEFISAVSPIWLLEKKISELQNFDETFKSERTFSRLSKLENTMANDANIKEFIQNHKCTFTVSEAIRVKDDIIYLTEDVNNSLYIYNTATKEDILVSENVIGVYYNDNSNNLYIDISGKYHEFNINTLSLVEFDIQKSGNYERLLYQIDNYLYFTNINNFVFTLFKVNILTGNKIILVESNKLAEFPPTYSELDKKNWSFYEISDHEKYVVGVDGYVKGYLSN